MNPLVLRTVNVVPRLVEHNAAPAANAWRFDAPAKALRMKDSAIGTQMPVRATRMDKKRFALREVMDVDSPPTQI